MTDKKKSKCPDYFWADLRLKFWYETYLPGQSFGFPIVFDHKESERKWCTKKILGEDEESRQIMTSLKNLLYYIIASAMICWWFVEDLVRGEENADR